MDDFDAELFGGWLGVYPEIILADHTRTPDVFIGPGMQRDSVRKGRVCPARARFQPVLTRDGQYRVCLCFRAAKGQATQVPVTIRIPYGGNVGATPSGWYHIMTMPFTSRVG